MRTSTPSILFCFLLALGTAACLQADPDDVVAPPDCQPAPTGEIDVVINELMARNAVTIADDKGNPGDWIEIYNRGASDADLCGFAVTDDLSEPNRAFLDEEAVVPAGGYLLVWLSGQQANNQPNHLAISLAQEGGELGLSDGRGTYVSKLAYGPQEVDFSAAREPDGSDAWVIEWHPSPGEANPDGGGAPVPPGAPSEPEQVPAAGDLTGEIMGYDVMLELGIRIEPDYVASLEEDPRTYVPAYLTYRGREVGPVGLRLKGQNSFRPIHEKPSFRINVDEFVDPAKFFGLDDLTLNNMHNDFSMMHERLAYLVARQIGPASRANHAVLTVNDQHYGLYANVETVKWHMIARWFDDPTGPLFEGTDVDFSPQYIDQFELDSGPDDRSMLSALAEDLARPDPEAALEAARDHVQMDAFLDFWAMEAIIGQFDALPYSAPGDDFFVYADPTSQRLWFLPWGMDEAFYSVEHDVTQVSSVLATTCLAVPSCAQAFEQRVWAMMELIEEMDLIAELDRVAAQIAPHVTADQRKAYTDAEVDEFQMQLFWFLDGRRANLEKIFGSGAE